METFLPSGSFPRRNLRACYVAAQCEIDLAWSFIRLARAEIEGGNSVHAAGLIAKATGAHNAALRYLSDMAESEDKRELLIAVRKLFDAIHAAERSRSRYADAACA